MIAKRMRFLCLSDIVITAIIHFPCRQLFTECARIGVTFEHHRGTKVKLQLEKMKLSVRTDIQPLRKRQ